MNSEVFKRLVVLAALILVIIAMVTFIKQIKTETEEEFGAIPGGCDESICDITDNNCSGYTDDH